MVFGQKIINRGHTVR